MSNKDATLLVDTLKLSFAKPYFLEIFDGLNLENIKDFNQLKNSGLSTE
jgi:hypothetical protein